MIKNKINKTDRVGPTYNNTIKSVHSKMDVNTSGSKNVHIAHMEVKGLMYLWFFSFIFLITIYLIGFAYLCSKLA